MYEFQKYNQSHGQEPYFILPRVQAIARQVIRALLCEGKLAVADENISLLWLLGKVNERLTVTSVAHPKFACVRKALALNDSVFRA